MRHDAINQLVTIKGEELNSLRLDMIRLDKLVQESQCQLDNARKAQDAFLQQIREAEQNGLMVSADNMMDQRNFLCHLHQQTKNAEQLLVSVTQQRDLAQRALEQLYVEKKSFELVAQRKNDAKKLKQTRRQFIMADNEELIRIERTRQLHAEH